MAHGDIAPDDPRADDIRRLLELHLAFMNETSPPEDVHALDVDGLLDPAVRFFSCRHNGVLLGIGALKRLDDHHAELKSMHTVQAVRGQGIGLAMLDYLVGVARHAGFGRLSLETGSMDDFAPARSMYAKRGFVPCPPFGEYWDSPYSTFMTLVLDDAATL